MTVDVFASKYKICILTLFSPKPFIKNFLVCSCVTTRKFNSVENMFLYVLGQTFASGHILYQFWDFKIVEMIKGLVCFFISRSRLLLSHYW